MKREKKNVFVGMSGGVDSSVAAFLLKKATPNNFEKLFGRPAPKGFRGYDVTGVFMKNWADPKYPCPWENDRRDAMRVAALLDIPFKTWDFTQEYRSMVVEYMIREYAAGCTPNPDVMCNSRIKFGVFLEKALSLGADYVATGHYVRLKADSGKRIGDRKNDLPAARYTLSAARDANKDQSYFLWTLTQDQLPHCLFPIGEYAKPEVRKIAKAAGLPTAEKPDSQGVCFVGDIDVASFLRDHIPAERGEVLTTSGRHVGEHDGVSFYTIGQRHGLGVGGGVPFYVAEKDVRANTLVVAEGPNDDRLFRSKLLATDINWVGGEPELPLACEARIRYRQPLQRCIVERQATSDLTRPSRQALGKRQGDATGPMSPVTCRFTDEQRAVTPGQSVVFYKDGVMLGGGIIA